MNTTKTMGLLALATLTLLAFAPSASAAAAPCNVGATFEPEVTGTMPSFYVNSHEDPPVGVDVGLVKLNEEVYHDLSCISQAVHVDH